MRSSRIEKSPSSTRSFSFVYSPIRGNGLHHCTETGRRRIVPVDTLLAYSTIMYYLIILGNGLAKIAGRDNRATKAAAIPRISYVTCPTAAESKLDRTQWLCNTFSHALIRIALAFDSTKFPCASMIRSKSHARIFSSAFLTTCLSPQPI